MPRRYISHCPLIVTEASFNEAAASNAAEMSWPRCLAASAKPGFNEAAASNAAEMPPRPSSSHHQLAGRFNEAAASNAAEINN